MNNLFDINPINENIKIEILNGTKIFIKDHFYKNPEHVLEFISDHPCKKWKSWDSPSYNGKHFLDQRHDFYDQRFEHITSEIEKLCEERVAQPGRIVTNCMTFYDKEFNDYENNYWGPHADLGYTALIYFNSQPSEGTNFYEQIAEDIWTTPEHFDPWRSKEKYKLIHTVESRFNRMVLFNGAKLIHGMAVNSDRYFYNRRINQAIFLVP